MTSLPTRHPSLAIQLSDKALTPIISSATDRTTTNPEQSDDDPSPASDSCDDGSGSAGSGSDTYTSANHNRPGSGSGHPTHTSPRLTQTAALRTLSSTALTAYTCAQRLELGNPVRIYVELSGDDEATTTPPCTPPSSGPLVISTFLDATTVSSPQEAGEQQQLLLQPQPSIQLQDQNKLPKQPATNGVTATSTSPQPPPRSAPNASPSQPYSSSVSPDPPPMLVGIVVAPNAGRATAVEARRAASRLECTGRRLQAAWAEQEEQQQQQRGTNNTSDSDNNNKREHAGGGEGEETEVTTETGMQSHHPHPSFHQRLGMSARES